MLVQLFSRQDARSEEGHEQVFVAEEFNALEEKPHRELWFDLLFHASQPAAHDFLAKDSRALEYHVFVTLAANAHVGQEVVHDGRRASCSGRLVKHATDFERVQHFDHSHGLIQHARPHFAIRSLVPTTWAEERRRK